MLYGSLLAIVLCGYLVVIETLMNNYFDIYLILTSFYLVPQIIKNAVTNTQLKHELAYLPFALSSTLITVILSLSLFYFI